MNLPNKLTLTRMLATPVFMIFMLLDFKGHFVVALLIFIVAALTDFFDGKIARERGLVTDFGKFLDPVADKMLTTAAFLAFLNANVGQGIVWIVFIVLLREFIVTSVRLVAASSGGKVIAANIWGKAKTVSQMVAIIFTIAVQAFADLFAGLLEELPIIGTVLWAGVSVALWISTILCAVSGIIYLVQNAEFIKGTK